ncbi:AAA family ATPase [Yoonia sp. 2307UL14-13]|uniref:AAA family ATPase n=1 Tax=Yoonia sp. 2307UL14-13 TaxID=3126506 RepID=UPI0030952A7F
MNASSTDRFHEALSFLPPALRTALAEAPDGSTCGALPVRDVALLWCDISGFSRHTAAFLSAGADGVDALYREIANHYDKVLETIHRNGGEPVTFVGDGLLSVWPADADGMAAAVARAANTAHDLVALRAQGETSFDLHHHIACGPFHTVQLGGRHGRWLAASVGQVLTDLARIAEIKAPNTIYLTAQAATHCPTDVVSDPVSDDGARILEGRIADVVMHAAEPAVPGPAAWDATLARVPRFAAGWIETVGSQYLAELRPVTAISVALPGFDQGAIGGAELLDEVVKNIQDIVHGRDGYVAEVTVDEKGVSVMVTFGTPPDAHSDDPLRSVLSAREIYAALMQRGVTCSLGVATGRMLCCIVGNTDRRCDLVLGDALIRSTRLAASDKAPILVDKNTMRATADKIAFADRPVMLRFKGEEKEAPGWPPATDPAHHMPSQAIAGREEESARLELCWDNVASGIYGTNIIVEGESGLGKTSMALHLRAHVDASGGQFRLESASAIAQNAPFSALRPLVMDLLGVMPLMTVGARQDAIRAHLPYHLRDSAPFLNALFPTGLEETDYTASLEGQARALHIQNFVVDMLQHVLGEQLVCLCIDDAQWLDAESRHVLSRLSEITRNLMIVILTQPGQDGEWERFAQDACFEHLRLGPLSRQGLRDLVRQRLRCKRVDDVLMDKIARQTELHPFYCAEVLRNLVDRKAIVVTDDIAVLARPDALETAALPDTVHGMVLQRLDQLEPGEQVSLRVASVAGLSFPTKLVCDIHPLRSPAEEVALQLNQQVVNGFLLPQATDDLPGFAFSHGIVREVAHSQMPAGQSRALHADAAIWIEKNVSEDRVSRLLELAYHWSEAGERERAVPFLLEEALRLFSQGFAVDAVQVGLRAMRTAGLAVPTAPEAFEEETKANIAEIERLTDGRHPTALLADMQPPPADLVLRFQTILSTAPFAFQSNQFGIFAWAATTAMRLVMENRAGPPHAFSMYSIVRSLLTNDRAAGAAWSRAALDLDAATRGSALPAAGFIDTWFHGHWRAPLADSLQTNRAAAARALADGDMQYASYNISGAAILKAQMGYPLRDVIAEAQAALAHPLTRNARMHAVLEMQMARALQGETSGPLSFSDPAIEEAKDIGWVAETEFANQIGFYHAARAVLHRYAGDHAGALTWYERAGPVRPAIAGQVVEFDLVLHALLARYGVILADRSALDSHAGAIQEELSNLAGWAALQEANFAHKSAIVGVIWEGLRGAGDAADRLTALAETLGPDTWLQDRAIALEYAALLDPVSERFMTAAAAYDDWGAKGTADRLRGLART